MLVVAAIGWAAGATTGAELLAEAVVHAPSAQDAALSTTEVQDLATVLTTLTGRHGERRPWVAGELARCP